MKTFVFVIFLTISVFAQTDTISYVPSNALLDTIGSYVKKQVKKYYLIEKTASEANNTSKQPTCITIEDLQIQSQNIEDRINRDMTNKLLEQINRAQHRNKTFLKGMGAVCFLTGVGGLICTFVDANREWEINVPTTRSSTTAVKVKNKWMPVHTGLTILSGGLMLSGLITWGF